MLVLDATPLIFLAAVDRFDLVEVMDEDCVIPEPVHDEVVTEGVEAGYPDARRVERAIEAGTLSVRSVEETELT